MKNFFAQIITENLRFSVHFLQLTGHLEMFADILKPIYKCDGLSPEPNMNRRLCNIHTCSFQCTARWCHLLHPVARCVHFSMRQAPDTSCTQLSGVYISMCGRQQTLLARSDSYFSVEQTRATSCTQLLGCTFQYEFLI